MTELNNHAERDHALLSASSAHRWLACPPSAVAAEAYPDQDTEYTREGTLAHEVAEAVARAVIDKGCYKKTTWDDGGLTLEGREYRAADITPEMLQCAEDYAGYILEQIHDPNALILLERRVDFSPWVPDGFGTCDCLIIQGDTLDVIDYKYGQGVKVSAKDNPQMKLYALGALHDYGFAYDVLKVRMHIFQPRMDNTDVDEMDVDALTRWANEEVKPTAEKAYKGKGKYSAGAHCTFCPHAGRCRTLTKVCTEYVEMHSQRVGVPILAPHEIAEVLRMKPLIELWLRRVDAQALTTLLDGGEIPGLKVVEGKPGNRKWSDEFRVFARLQEAGYSQEDISETKLLSPAGIDKLLGKKQAAELLADLITRAPGKPTVVPDTDSRPPYDRTADFDKLD